MKDHLTLRAFIPEFKSNINQSTSKNQDKVIVGSPDNHSDELGLISSR